MCRRVFEQLAAIMAFQFTCPQGHLLSAEESQAGQHCHCPHCGVLFIIPAPLGYQSVPYSPSAPYTPPVPFSQEPPFSPAQQYPTEQPFGSFPPAPFPASPFASTPFPTPAPPPVETPSMPQDLLNELPAPPTAAGLPDGAGLAGGADLLANMETGLFHILCPNGHELETPAEMLGEYAMCPFCQAQFTLTYEQSIEFQRRKEAEQDALDERAGRIWIRWAIFFAVVVVVGLITMAVLFNH